MLMCILPPALRGTLAQKKKTLETKSQTKCSEKSDRRYAVCHGAWSTKTTALFNTWMAPDLNPGRRLDFSSPDGQKVIRVRDVHVRIEIDGRLNWTPFGNMHDAEVGWAPDSKRLFVTWTETGELGAWHTQVFDVTDHGLREIPGVTRHVRGDLIARMKRAPIPKWVTRAYRPMWDWMDYCGNDVVGSQWLNGSKELLVAGLAGPDSGCKYMGDFVAYRIDVASGDLLQAYSEREAVRIFGDKDLPRVDPDEDEIQ